MQAPFNALIIAHERMKVFAYIGMTNALLQLGVACLISVAAFDRLIFYSALHSVVVMGIYAFYHLYCKYRMEGYSFGKAMDKSLLKEMVSYSGWFLFGAVSGMAWSAGTNILMNIFFGPVVNAANAIAQQVNSAINSFYTNFTMSLNPQIVKTYAVDDREQMKSLIFRGGKFSFFLLSIFLIPVFLETDVLLRLWLKNVPEYAGVFTRFIVFVSLTGCFGTTLSMSIQATGIIKLYNIVVGSILLLSLPITYICYKFGYMPASAYIGMIITTAIAVFARMFFLKKLLRIDYSDYFKYVLWVSFIVFIFSMIPPLFAHRIMNEGFVRLFVVACVGLFSSLASIYLLGLTQAERKFVNVTIRRIILKKQDLN
jgi:O-antigen/teichoic acid export membrane protein